MGRPFCFTVALLAFAASTASGQVEYQSQIKPILAEHCFSCHSALRQKGELRLDAISLIRRGGSSGSALVAGQPDNSLIVDALRARDGVTKMPPDGSAAVKASDIALIEQWIREGARAENEPIPDDPREHWAYRPPHKIAGVKERNPIDHYFGRLHATEGLNRQPAASRDI
ncbi:MAG: c-type cytochrome domain-containing protein, partial [Pirellulaceae bacterium]|nr:c-type cytochrome domain-containing protein [Pirellulaceae bacterium]